MSEHRLELERRHGVRFFALFGSVARDQASSDSDIDVLVEFERPPGFDGYMQLKEHLEAVLGHRVREGRRAGRFSRVGGTWPSGEKHRSSR